MPSVKALAAALTASIALAAAAAGPASAELIGEESFAPAGAQVGAALNAPDRINLAPYDERETSIEGSVEDFYRAETKALGDGWQPPVIKPASSACAGAPANARFCAADVSVSYDGSYMRTAYARFGDAGAGIVMAHEFAHAFQSEEALDASSQVHELQADCFAGAWLWTREQSMTDAITMPEIIRAATGMLNPNHDNGGPGLQRVKAAQYGFTEYDRNHDLSSCIEHADVLPLLD